MLEVYFRQVSISLVPLLTAQLTLDESMIRVLHTSRGVVIAAPMPPARDPITAASIGSTRSPLYWPYLLLKNSYSGNWMHVNGISRATVGRKPRYSPNNPSVFRTLDTALAVVLNWLICIRCLMTSVGTRTVHADYDPFLVYSARIP